MKTATITHIAPDLCAAVDIAVERIPPLWPLDRFVAVNPFLGLADRPFSDACGTLRRTTGHAPVQKPAEYLTLWKSGAITPSDLAPHTDAEWSSDRLLETLERSALTTVEAGPRVITFAELLDQTLPHAHWSRFVAEEIAKWCAVHFDRNQTTWNSPWRHLGLYDAWKSGASMDVKPEAFGLPGFRAFVCSLPDDHDAAILQVWKRLDPQDADPADFLHRQLATITGWAGHARYLAHEDALRGKTNTTLRQLLAIRLAYDAALHLAFGSEPQVAAAWRNQPAADNLADLYEALSRWQSAYETGYQRDLAAQLGAQPARPPASRPPLQAIFCIDVRSEIIRRHLEAALPGTHTLGFAGFFGFPVAHQPANVLKPSPRCPVLLAPPICSREPQPSGIVRQNAEKGAWKAFQNSAASCFTFVESLGLVFGGELIRAHDKSVCPKAAPTPELDELPLDELAILAENALRGMSLTQNFARLVLFCGHGSHSANNPFASSLECGACGGHSGDVNARLAAATLNRPDLRAALAERGIEIPDDTLFLAGRHDTLSDDFLLYDIEAAPDTHRDDIAALGAALVKAGGATRMERAPRLGLGHHPTGPSLDRAIRSRGSDIAQLRPEWALANNAALIAAPRSRTSHLKLGGRVFLHEYDPATDPESAILTAILTAPVIVASWINLQYYGSRIDPANLCAGDKTIHQVVAGLGVIEGNAGDLRCGLPMQSIHDGSNFLHEPRRLTVFIENSPERIEAVLAAQAGVRQLFDHLWIHLVALSATTPLIRRPGGRWEELNPPKL